MTTLDGPLAVPEEVKAKSPLGLREGVVLMAIQVVTLTYGAGLNPPGGAWADTKDGHLTGDPILAITHHGRYNVFSNSNTTALMASAAVVLLLLFVRGPNSRRLWFMTVLRTVLMLAMVALAVAYAAGATRHNFTAKYAWVSVGFLILYVVFIVLFAWIVSAVKGTVGTPLPLYSRIMVSAIFVASMTYTAGLSPPGGFWLDTQDGHRAGDPALLVHYRRRFTAFFVGNTMAFVASLFITPLVLTNKSGPMGNCSMQCLYNVISNVQQCGLTVAYAAGSNLDKAYIAYVLLGGLGLVPVMILIFVMTRSFVWAPILNLVKDCFKRKDGDSTSPHDAATMADGDSTSPREEQEGEKQKGMEPFFVLLFTTFSAAVTYQAGLNPPGGLWQDDLNGHNAGYPILLAKQPMRYRVFIYCNSMALVASLVAIVMSLTEKCQNQKTRALNGLLVLDLISLIGAYAAGCCRDVETSIHVIALGGAIVVYVVFHMAFLMSPKKNRKHGQKKDEKGEAKKDEKGEDDKKLEWDRDLMLGILGATLTYQTGLSPPGGFSQSDDEFGHHAGEPVLLSTYPSRYKVFFYLNALCFMASIFLTIFFVNPYLYRAGIRCRALFICVLAVFFGLIGAYAAGSYRSLGPSICIIVLGAAVFIFIILMLLLFSKYSEQGPLVDKESEHKSDEEGEQGEHKSDQEVEQGEHDAIEYLVLIGSIGAIVTYQAAFAPPRGFWPDDSNGHAVGNPVLRDMNGYLYRLYFFFNTTAFLASLFIMNSAPMVFAVQMSQQIYQQLRNEEEEEEIQEDPADHEKKEEQKEYPGRKKKEQQIPFAVLLAPTVLFAIGILGAYAAGSSSGWNNNSTFAVALVAPVLFVTFLLDHVLEWVRNNKKMANFMEVFRE